ncbi:unnamed protein product [Musa hybrid cultivar]
MEQEEYTKEEINWSYIEFVDNQDVLDLIEKVSELEETMVCIRLTVVYGGEKMVHINIIDGWKLLVSLVYSIKQQEVDPSTRGFSYMKPGGIIALLDEACMFPRSTHETFAQKLYQTLKNNKRFIKPKLSCTNFTICHYAGEVTYQADYFLDKNKDYVVAEHQDLLNASKCPFVSGLFPPLPEETSKSSKFSSIGSWFKVIFFFVPTTSISDGNVLKPSIFENFNVIQQLRCGGVLEAIRISCAGYPTRRTFYEFLLRFSLLAPEVLEGNFDDKAACQKILDKIGLKGYQLGKSKVFLRAGQMAELDARRAEVLGRAARTIQRQIRTYIARKEFLRLRQASVYLQSLWRGRLACKLYECIRREAAAVKIQKNLRRYFARKSYTALRMSAITLQTGSREMIARNDFRLRKQTKASICIQSQWRCHRDYSYHKRLQKATLTYQCAWRQRLARKELRKPRMAARETGALKEAKDNLEKRVEELTWRLQLEKRLRTDLEETKAQEIAKLQDMLHEMQLQVEQAKSTVIKEREAARKTIEEALPIIKETPVLVQDTEKIDLLNAETENLKVLLLIEKQATDSANKAFAEAQNRNIELVKKVEDSEMRADQFQDTVQRLEERVSNLESEKQVLRQQAVAISPTSRASCSKTTIFQVPISFNSFSTFSQLAHYYQAFLCDLSPGSPNSRELQNDDKPHKSLNEKQQENQDLLIECISKDLGFSGGRPIAACVIYRCLLHWRSFEVERTTIFDRIIQTIGSAIEAQDNIDVLSHWLSNSCTLLLLLQRTLKASGAASLTPQRRRTSALFGRMSQGIRASPQSAGLFSFSGRMMGGLSDLRQVEAKYPALLFKQQLTAFLEKIYGMIGDNLKKEVSSLLASCIQAPRTSRASLIRGS